MSSGGSARKARYAHRRSIVISPRRGWARDDFAEIWRYRHLLSVLALRDIKVRYKQTILGVAWVVIQPLTTMLVFATLFRYLLAGGNLPTYGNVPYAISTCTALVVWRLFADSIVQSSNSIVSNRGLITRVYFPRLLIPIAPVISAFVDFLVGACAVVVLILGYQCFSSTYQFHFRWPLLTLPLFLLLAVTTSFALSLWFSALNAIYRDVKYAVPFFAQTLMFLTPVIYAAERVTQHLPRWGVVVYGLNPMVGVVEGTRWALLGVGSPPSLMIFLSTFGVILALVSGLCFFRIMERAFADIV